MHLQNILPVRIHSKIWRRCRLECNTATVFSRIVWSENIGPRGCSRADGLRYLWSCNENEADLEKETGAKFPATIPASPDMGTGTPAWNSNHHEVIPCAHVLVFMDDRANTRFGMKLNTCGKAPRSIISRAYAICIAGLQTTSDAVWRVRDLGWQSHAAST